jgi:hypothetical protein
VRAVAEASDNVMLERGAWATVQGPPAPRFGFVPGAVRALPPLLAGVGTDVRPFAVSCHSCASAAHAATPSAQPSDPSNQYLGLRPGGVPRCIVGAEDRVAPPAARGQRERAALHAPLQPAPSPGHGCARPHARHRPPGIAHPHPPTRHPPTPGACTAAQMHHFFPLTNHPPTTATHHRTEHTCRPCFPLRAGCASWRECEAAVAANGTLRLSGSMAQPLGAAVPLRVDWTSVPPAAELHVGLRLEGVEHAVAEGQPGEVAAFVFGTPASSCPPGGCSRTQHRAPCTCWAHSCGTPISCSAGWKWRRRTIGSVRFGAHLPQTPCAHQLQCQWQWLVAGLLLPFQTRICHSKASLPLRPAAQGRLACV